MSAGRRSGGISGENWFYQNEPPIWNDPKLTRFTPRAVVGAVHAALQYVERNRAKLFSLPAETGEERIEQ